MGIVLRPITSIERSLFNPKTRLFNDYLCDPSRLKGHFTYLPIEIDKALTELPKAKVDIPGLREYNQRLGAPDVTLKNIDLLARERCFVIMSGQQPGLLLGPLYTLYKAIHTIKLSQHLSTTNKSNFIPVFWNASEDSDWDEVNHLYFLSGDRGVNKIIVSLNEEFQGSSLGKVLLEGVNTDDFLAELKKLLPQTEFRDKCLELINDSKDRAVSFSDWFSSLLLLLLGDYGLILFDPICIEVKELVRPIFQQEIEEPLSTNRLLVATGENLVEGGYKPQIHKVSSRCNLFLEENGKRSVLNFDGNYFKSSRGSYSKDELLRILDKQPERFTPDVALRPILASALFPVLCYVAGPSEISYYGQLKGVYDRYNLKMPVIIPRVSLSLVEARIIDILTSNSLKPWELSDSVEAIANRLIRQDNGLKIGEKFSAARRDVIEILDSLMEGIPRFSPSLMEALNRIKGKFDYELKGLEDKFIKDKRKSDTILIDRLKRAKERLYPNNLPQERVLNIFYFLVKYGLEFIDSLYEAFPLDYTRHYYLSIEYVYES